MTLTFNNLVQMVRFFKVLFKTDIQENKEARLYARKRIFYEFFWANGNFRPSG